MEQERSRHFNNNQVGQFKQMASRPKIEHHFATEGCDRQLAIDSEVDTNSHHHQQETTSINMNLLDSKSNNEHRHRLRANNQQQQ